MPERLSVAVVVPTIPGREHLLRRALTSVLAQTRPLDYAAGDQLIVEQDPGRTGAAATRNRALARVTADVIAWLDDDDELLPNHLKACLRVLSQDRTVSLVYPRPRMVGGKDPTAVTHQGRFPVSPWGLRWCPEFAKHLRVHGSFIPMTHLVRAGDVRAVGGFPEGETLPSGRYRGEDEGYLIRLLDVGCSFEHLDAATWRWHVHNAQTAGRAK